MARRQEAEEDFASSLAGRFPLRGWLLLLTVFALLAIGLTVLSSAGAAGGEPDSGYFRRQLVWLALAVSAGGCTYALGVRRLRALALPLAALSLLALFLVLIPGIGIEVNGSRRWIALGGFRFQPSEPAKLGLLVLFAWYLDREARHLDQFVRGFLVPGLLVAPFAVALLLEPDLGTTALYAAVAGGLLLAAGTRFSYLLLGATAGLAGLFALILRSPERLDRILAFLEPAAHRSDGGYQLWQSLLGFGTGGLSGVGAGRGRQHLAFLPEAHTDFIFAVVGEELGFVATGSVVLLFVVFFLLVFLQLRKAPDLFEFTIVCGALLFLCGQALFNMGVVTGLLPTKGMSLPLISYGGSNLVLVFALLGFILSAFRLWEAPVLARPREIRSTA
jgi:cell division protein FtsW